MLANATIDLPTVLYLHMTSLVAGALGMLNIRFRIERSSGLGFLATAFVMLAIGGALAGFGLHNAVPREMWTHVSLLLGTGGYTLLWIGLSELSGFPRRRYQQIAAAVPLFLGLLGLATQFPLDDNIRSSVFHLNAASFLGLSAFTIWREQRTEPLPSRLLLAIVLLVSGAIYLVRFSLIATQTPSVLGMPQAFFVQIICNFAIALLVTSIVAERTMYRLKLMAETDELTGIGNRRSLLACLSGRVIAGSAVALIDLDHFKAINDTHGHAAGDQVLLATARTLKQELRDQDVLARFGGEEFAVFFPKLREQDCAVIAERLRSAIGRLRIAANGTEIQVTASIGLAWIEDTGKSWSEWLQAADAACYEAKRTGRNRSVIRRAYE
jgi:diguanylate cyclase (GGDEF)-like protein